jgi:hypothetical protein
MRINHKSLNHHSISSLKLEMINIDGWDLETSVRIPPVNSICAKTVNNTDFSETILSSVAHVLVNVC